MNYAGHDIEIRGVWSLEQAEYLGNVVNTKGTIYIFCRDHKAAVRIPPACKICRKVKP